MKFIRASIQYYIRRLMNDEFFSIAGFSDAEWFSILGIRDGDTTGLGQIINTDHGKRLLQVLIRRDDDPLFLFAAPDCLYKIPELYRGIPIDDLIDQVGIKSVWYERDMVTDDMARHSKMFPFIETIRRMSRVVIIGPQALRDIDFFEYDYFVEIPTPNLHMETNGIEDAVEVASGYGRPGLYLVSAGVSAAIIIDRLHDEIPNSFFMDCGSIWDAFVGIGGQRTWRSILYNDPVKLKQWKKENLNA